MKNKKDKNPLIQEYLDYLLTVKGYSENTRNSYEYDLIWLMRFLRYRLTDLDESQLMTTGRDGKSRIDYSLIAIDQVGLDLLEKVRFPDLYAFLGFCASEIDNLESSRKRKVTSVKGFFRFLTQVRHYLKDDPSLELEAPKLGKAYPKALTLEQAQDLLSAVDGKHAVRDRAILTLFLNNGLRVSELCKLKLTDIQADILHINGKGNKDRSLFLNDACLQALAAWIPEREAQLTRLHKQSDYLFISQKGGAFTNRGIEYMVEKYILKIGLDPRQYTVHSLRHTAATLMHKYGEVDIRTLQAVLGHESTQTTQIYTHLDNDELQKALNHNPLSHWETEEDADVSVVFNLNRRSS